MVRNPNYQLLHEIEVRRQTEDALKNSEALYASLVENVPLFILRKDLEGRFTFAQSGVL